MHRGGQPLKKRRGSFKMAELDQLPDESSSAKALVSLKEGSLSNTWNEKYTSLQKTPVWKGRNTGSNVEMPFRNSKRSRLFSDEDDRQINTRSPKRNQRIAMVPQRTCKKQRNENWRSKYIKNMVVRPSPQLDGVWLPPLTPLTEITIEGPDRAEEKCRTKF